MLTYQYEARNAKTGEKVKSTIQADNEQGAAKLLKDQGLAPLSVKVEHAGRISILNRVKTKDKVLFSRQLATLINAGLPLVQSLRNVAQQTKSKPLKAVLNQVIIDVETGKSFSSALAKHPNVFNNVFVSLVAAGETSGTLDRGLEKLADQQEKDADIMSKVRGAMIYPLIVLCVMAGVVTFMLIKVLPEVQNIYKGLPGVSLPIETRALLDLSHLLVHFWWVILILIIIAGMLWSKNHRSPAVKKVTDSFKMRAWPFGPLFMKMYMARFARTSTTLVASGVPLLQVLEITSSAVDNVHISASIKSAADKVKGGRALSDALTNDKNFLELVPSMIRIGEQSGALDTMLDKAATYYEKEVDNEIKTISTLIEPVLMIIMGVVAILIVVAILLPIYGLVNQSGFTNGGA